MTRIVVVDQIVEGIAVLIQDGDEQPIHVPRRELPSGTREGDCLRLEEKGQIRTFHLAPEETARRRQRIRSKLDRLRAR